MTRAGIVTVAGKPNAGKSTLLNRLVGQKLAITSPKPQSTRDRIVGIISFEKTQLVLFDTPGLLQPRYALQSAMRSTSLRAIEDADVIAYLSDASKGPAIPLVESAGLDRMPRAPVLTIYNKVDLLSAAALENRRVEEPEALFISAQDGSGVPALLTRLSQAVPESPFLYGEDDASTQSVRFFVAEFVRETALELLDDEVPYAVACHIEEFREGQSPLYIRAVLYVERESQKGILIGAGGAQIRALGQQARAKIESLVGESVYLDLRVKVLANWRRNPQALQRLGFVVPQEHGP
jgi:GTP-binding protein Era